MQIPGVGWFVGGTDTEGPDGIDPVRTTYTVASNASGQWESFGPLPVAE